MHWLIQKQDSDNPIDKMYLYAKDLSEPKYQFLIKKREDAGIKVGLSPSKKKLCYLLH